MKRISLSKITTNGRTMLLAYDHGLEHGPTDFNDRNVDPSYILEIAKKGKFNGIILQKGIAEKYYDKKSKIPLIVKLNGKTIFQKGDPVSTQFCTVKEAIDLGAKAVGFTIYMGSVHQPRMMKEFENVEKEAHAHGLPVIAWIYPRGKAIKNEFSKKNMAYAARLGLELGADIIKMRYGNNISNLQWAVKSAGKTKIVIAGGSKKTDKAVLKEAHDAISAGAIGMAIGRSIWQNKEPLKMAKSLKEIIYKNKSVEQALKVFK